MRWCTGRLYLGAPRDPGAHVTANVASAMLRASCAERRSPRARSGAVVVFGHLSPMPKTARSSPDSTALGVIVAIGFCHLLNDMMQSLLPAIYPGLKVDFGLTFGQVGLITFAYQITASLLQPLVG